MKKFLVPLGNLEPQCSPLVAGFWRLKHWGMSAPALLNFIEALVDLGVTTVDHAMVYGSEPLFGEALTLKPALRQQLQIVTKCGIKPVGFGALGAVDINHYDSSYRAIIQSVDHSLMSMRTDYIDVLLIHRPDFLMDVHAMADAFKVLKQQGKVNYFGVSNFTVAQFNVLNSAWSEGLVTNQVEMSPYYMQALDSGVFEQCIQANIKPMLWSCLAGGQLLKPVDPKGERISAAIKVVQQELGVATPEPIIYAWLRTLPCCPLPILGTSNIGRVKEAVKCLDLTLSHEQWYRIWQASEGSPVP